MLKTSCLCIVVLLLNSFNLNGETLELKGHDREVTSTCFSPDGSQIVSGSKDKNVRIWDAKTGKNIQTLNGHADAVTCVCFSPDGSQVVSGSEDKTVRIWDAKTGKNIQTFIAHDSYITAIDYSPDGEFIATGCNDNSMKIWNSSNGKMVHKLEGHSAKILDLNFSPNSKQLVSCSERDGLYGQIKVWDIASGKEIYSVRGDPRRTVRGIANQLQGDINAVRFSPDGKQFASAGANMTINLWDGPSGALIRTFECDLLRTDGPGHSGPVRSLGFSPSVSVVVSNSNNTAKFWDTRTGKEIYTLRGNGVPMKGIKFSPEGKRVIVSQENVIFITNLEKLDFLGEAVIPKVLVTTRPPPSVQKPDSPEIKPATKPIVEALFSEAKAKEAQKETAKNLQKEVDEKEDLGKGIKLEMVLIPAGTFMRGSPSSEKGRYDNETQHKVTITKPFYIGKYEVTQEQWEAVMGERTRSRTKGAKLPVTDVSWEDCMDFIKKLNSKTNGVYGLPTEAEWEYACRAGTTTAYSFGDSLTKSDANYGDGTLGHTKTVGSYKPNAFGLYDMHGNVSEWCADWKEEYPSGSATDPIGVRMGIYRVLRGGSFDGNGLSARSSYRFSSSRPSNRDDDLGFRLARTTDNQLVVPFTEIKAKDIQKEVAKSLKKEVDEKEDLGKGIKLEMVLIPAGKFKMGSPKSEKYNKDNELQHEVTLTKSFYLGKYEVTQDQWEAVTGNSPSQIKGKMLPVTGVSWEDCQEFIEKLNTKTTGGYRLPTEAEWEYACRAGTTTAYSFGDSITIYDARFNSSSLKAVGSYKPNAFGLYDMHGNVMEWCEDWFGNYPAGAVIDPKGPATFGKVRVLRGGSYYNLVHFSDARSAARDYDKTTNGRNSIYGFRLARTP